MKKLLTFALAVLAVTFCATAQSDESEVQEVINRLFAAMNASDSVMLQSTFAREVTMASVFKNKEGKQVFTRENSIAGFAKSVAGAAKGSLTEEIWNLKIQIDGEFAQAWCDYAFFYNHKFTHCGVDAFHLVKTESGWKIFHLADTRRREGCAVPKKIQKKHLSK